MVYSAGGLNLFRLIAGPAEFEAWSDMYMEPAGWSTAACPDYQQPELSRSSYLHAAGILLSLSKHHIWYLSAAAHAEATLHS